MPGTAARLLSPFVQTREKAVMTPEPGSGARETLSIMTACEAMKVPRSTMYDYISSGAVEYYRTAGGSIRIFVDSLQNAQQRRNQILKRRLQAGRERQSSFASVESAPGAGTQPTRAADNPFRDLPLFRWTGRPQLVRNLGRPARDACPYCAAPLAVNNLYDSTEPEHESEERLYCLLCGWSCYYECRPLTRGFGHQFYVVKTLRSFAASHPRIDAFERRVLDAPSDPSLEWRVESVAARAFGERPYSMLTSTSSDASAVLLAIRIGNGYVVLLCAEPAHGGTVTLAVVSLLHSARIDWENAAMRLHMRTHPPTPLTIPLEAAREDFAVGLTDGRQFLEFLDLCSPVQPRLEALNAAHRDEIVSERRHSHHRYSWRVALDLMSAIEET